MNIHPLIKEGLNPEQLEAVLQIKNCVVGAGAGSGKTFVLARRFAHLVIDRKIPVDRILTLTFTNKAAAEMYRRIYETLADIAVLTQPSDPARFLAHQAISDFHTARIQTIDSYCSSLLSYGARFYGIRPDFCLDNERIKDFVQTTAIDFVLEHRTSSALQSLMGTEKLEIIAQELFARPVLSYSNLIQKIDFSVFTQKQIQEIFRAWDEQTAKIPAAIPAIIEKYSDCADSARILFSFSVQKEELATYFSLVQDRLCTLQKKETERESLQEKLTQFLEALYYLKKKQKPRSKDEASLAAKNALQEIRSVYDILSGIVQYVLCFHHVQELLPLLEKFYARCSDWKRTSGILSFSDVSSLALDILIKHPDIRQNEKQRISAIMIDEFQDNNHMQRDMLFLIAEKLERTAASVPQGSELCSDKLFFVGDEKQSIYLFRGADVSVFRKLKEDLDQGGDSKSSLSLGVNYRSSASLIYAFNKIFGGDELNPEGFSVFIKKCHLADGKNLPPFEAEYTALRPPSEKDVDHKTQKLSKVKAEEAPIRFCLLNTGTSAEGGDETEEDIPDDEENLEKIENLAVFTAKKIAELCSAEESSDGEPAFQPKDIAILFRSYSKQHLYEKHLRLLGIPYITENITGFFGDAPVNDLYNLLRLIVYPQDAAAFGAILRSPFVRLPAQSLNACLLAVSEAQKDDPSKDELFCPENGRLLDGEAAYRYAAGLENYTDLRKAAAEKNCADLISFLWYNYGYRYETLWNIDNALFSELYDYLYELARLFDAEGKTLAAFVDYLADLSSKGERIEDMDIPFERSGAVQLMSIHKSKGLQFPVVFLCGISSIERSKSINNKIYADDEWGYSFNFPVLSAIKEGKKNYFFDLVSAKKKQKEQAELRRLLYVAMTRAKQKIYITADFSVNTEAQKLKERSDNLTEILAAVFKEKIKKEGAKEQTDSFVLPQYRLYSSSFFALLLPHIAESATTGAKPFPFILEEIPVISRNQVMSLKARQKRLSMIEVQKEVQDFYKKSFLIQTPIVESPYRSPSKTTEAAETNLFFDTSAAPSCIFDPAWSEIDEIIKAVPNNNFGYKDFGIIAHGFVEAALKKEQPKIPAEISSVLSGKQLASLFAIAADMADRFILSPLGQDAKAALWRKTEYDFKLLLNTPKKIIVRGKIDLLYETQNGKLIIVDFKSDAQENPESYFVQLAAYRRAAASMRNKDFDAVQCCLYYLRTGHCVDITKQSAAISLEDIMP